MIDRIRIEQDAFAGNGNITSFQLVIREETRRKTLRKIVGNDLLSFLSRLRSCDQLWNNPDLKKALYTFCIRVLRRIYDDKRHLDPTWTRYEMPGVFWDIMDSFLNEAEISHVLKPPKWKSRWFNAEINLKKWTTVNDRAIASTARVVNAFCHARQAKRAQQVIRMAHLAYAPHKRDRINQHMTDYLVEELQFAFLPNTKNM